MNPIPSRRALMDALERLYLDKSAFVAAYRKEPSATTEQFIANPACFGPLRTYVGALSVKANITRVRRLLLKIIREQIHSPTSD